jgi:hypothetical protein
VIAGVVSYYHIHIHVLSYLCISYIYMVRVLSFQGHCMSSEFLCSCLGLCQESKGLAIVDNRRAGGA